MKVKCPRCKAALEYEPRSVQTCSNCNAKVKMPEPDRLPEKLRNRWWGIGDEAKRASRELAKEPCNSDKQPDFADAILDVLNAANEKDRQARIAEEKRREKEEAAMRADEEALEAELFTAMRDFKARKQAVEPPDVELLDLPAPEQTVMPQKGEGEPGHIQSRLSPCPDCGKSVSKRAKQCPDCGCPLAELEAERLHAKQPPGAGDAKRKHEQPVRQLSKPHQTESESAYATSRLKPCPGCLLLVPELARQCPECGRLLAEVAPNTVPTRKPAPSRTKTLANSPTTKNIHRNGQQQDPLAALSAFLMAILLLLLSWVLVTSNKPMPRLRLFEEPEPEYEVEYDEGPLPYEYYEQKGISREAYDAARPYMD